MQEKQTKIKITRRSEDFSRWYTDVIAAADLADYSSVKGCMVIKPNGYALWERIQSVLDKKFKETGVVNAYFPLFIPESFIKREAEHVEGFSPELAVVTHAGGKKLEEPLVIRPTSETIINASYAKWIKSWRDLPVLINQWANVVRWELRTRLFLRTTEFLWQEGHTAHTTEDEAENRALTMLEVYREFAENYLAIPVIPGLKSENEKFAGALRSYTIEAMMQDKKALQSGTSHNLGQNFAKAFDIKYQDQNNKWQYVWQTSWGVSTRLIGAVIMVHGDDKGIIMPPRVAPIHVVIVPIWKNKKEFDAIIEIAETLLKGTADINMHIDRRDSRPAWKYYEWERRGVPIRIEIGPRDVEAKQVVRVRRDTGDKKNIKLADFKKEIESTLDEIQKNLYERATAFLRENTYTVESYDEFKKIIRDKGGFINAQWCGDSTCENKIKEETKATIRCIPLEGNKGSGNCIRCGNESRHKVLFGLAY